MAVTFDRTGFNIDGRDDFFVSGEFHYFRVPHDDWRRRMRLFKESGGTALATYIPWLIHEPEEGSILFGDRPERDLAGFLKMAAEEGLKVIVRPGPYQYSELVNSGIPTWLIEKHPEILARNVNGELFCESAVSYMHPTFLKYAERYVRHVAKIIRPFTEENGGTVTMVQADNELMGVQVWRGSIDYNPETFGYGRADGYYARFLAKKYGDIAALNKAYDTDYPDFASVRPIAESCHGEAELRHVRDQQKCYLENCFDYIETITAWLRAEGVNAPMCHNSGNPGMNALFVDLTKRMNEPFLLGSDHYYTLNQDWAQNNPTPQYALYVQHSMAMLRAMGMPPSVLEMPGGSPSDTPPILKNDLLACYMTNLAVGMRGVNYYVYTGGPNFPGSGDTCDIYDYNALIHADGTLNDTFEAMREFHKFLIDNRDLSHAKQIASVQVGYTWEDAQAVGLNDAGHGASGETLDFLRRGIMYTLMCGNYSGEYVNLNDEAFDVSRPLIVAASDRMSWAAQTRLVEFMRAGGRVIIAPAVPEIDEQGNTCTVLKDYIGGYTALGCACYPNRNPSALREGVSQTLIVNGRRVYGLNAGHVYTDLPTGAQAVLTDAADGKVLGFKAGNCIVFGAKWHMSTFNQADMLAEIVRAMGAQPTERLTNRNLFHTLWQLPGGGKMLFILNLFSSPQSTDVIMSDGQQLHADLDAMQVRAFRLD